MSMRVSTARLVFALTFAGLALHPAAAAQLKGLEAPGPFPPLRDKLQLFGQFVGDWRCTVVMVNPDGSKQPPNNCEWHWGWILEGRGIQDVWIVRPADGGANPIEFGTTVRIYDAKHDVWHCVFLGSVKNNVVVLTARQVGNEIVLETGNDQGRVGQWVFSAVTDKSFRWRSQVSFDGGKSWHVGQEMNVWRER
jgi:hypothetical protein